MTTPFILPFATEPALAVLGGKGKSLASLTNAGFAVPQGFHITTAAYQHFIDSNDLHDAIIGAAKPEERQGSLSFETGAAKVKALFAAAAFPEDLAHGIAAAFGDFASTPVAVRSSATAEDLPDLSFAGQQDTYLNILGVEALLPAVRNCWASLWTARAISYRHQMGIAHDDVAMAVVVQEMVNAEVSGVLFTANPATGCRDELIINASFGLGEAIVSGEVTPDAYVIERHTHAIRDKVIGAKEQMVVYDGAQGTRFEAVDSARRETESLTADQLGELSTLAVTVEHHFGGQPQDIEWLFAEGKLWLLQSRPITNLPPPPLTNVSWEAPEPHAYLGRSQLVEHIPDPVSPLFEDLHMRQSLQHYWGLNLSGNGRHSYEDTQPPNCFVVQTTVNGFAYRHLGEPPRTARPPGERQRQWLSPWLQKPLNGLKGKLSTWRIYLLWVAEWRYLSLPRYLREIRRWQQLAPATATVEELWAGIKAMSKADARYWYRGGVWNAFSLTRGTEFQLHRFLQQHAPDQFTSGQFLSGLPSIAFNGQLALWRVSRQIRASANLYRLTVETPAKQLLQRLRNHAEGAAVSAAIDDYFTTYGHQIFTLDFADPSEAEAPDSILQSLQSLVLQADYDPIARQRDLAGKRNAIIQAANQHFQGDLKRQFRWLLWKARHFYPNREEAMFHMGKAWTVLRPLALELGRRLTTAGTLTDADDVFYLNTDELGRAIRALKHSAGISAYADVAIARRQLREARRRLAPPFHIPGPPPWAKQEAEPVAEDTDVLKGSPVSPGKVTATVSLVLSPAEFSKMRPGTILVCPTTTPAWTQLFPQAVGLVTNVGGILAHGSIVAREYGIPAVLGIADATQRISHGQTITVDGDRGTVTLE